jgi:Spy/CpxP family protein refolding chaperone
VKNVRSILAVAAAGLALAVGLAFAQTEGGGSMHHGMGGMRAHMMGGGEFAMFLHQLNLTDDQKAQVKQVFQTERPTLKPMMQQEAQAHLEMMKLITGGNFNLAKASTLASQEAQIHMQMQLEHAKIGAQIYNLLNSDQKAKVADMISKHEQMIQQHSENKEQSAPAEQQ